MYKISDKNYKLITLTFLLLLTNITVGASEIWCQMYLNYATVLNLLCEFYFYVIFISIMLDYSFMWVFISSFFPLFNDLLIPEYGIINNLNKLSSEYDIL